MTPGDFKWKHFAPEIILWCLLWYGSTPMSYANVSDMLAERGISVHRSTIYRWFIEYAPILRQKLKRYQFTHADSSWQLDETYIKVNGKWFYLYRAINKHGTTLDFYFSAKRNKNAAYQFLKRVLKPYPVERQPKILNTDKHSSYGYAITRLMKEGKLRDDAKQRQVKYLNNRIESDHAPIKKLVKAAEGFKRPNRAWSTLQGFETMRRLNKGQFDIWLRCDEPECRVRERSAFMNRLFNIETVLA
ncbi:IS6 family transposase [Yersinia intermedia]|uniref:IS6 family transposase n=1 Tax=Yersinia intermedia TaxID=631 RepID=UPI0005DEE76B|nr:IS6 family transposase [Yersinia intermedia]CNB53778.1 transposase [Yersinia intermedia]CRF13257.1 transposase [Yersinia intermedia]